MAETRCVHCGEPIPSRGKVVKIGQGVLTSEGFVERRVYGLAHESCFMRAVATPQAVLAQVQELAAASGA